MKNNEEYSRELLRRCYMLSQASPDTSTQNGAIILNRHGIEVGSGCNDFTVGIFPTPQLLERPLKYSYIEHAERSAIFDAARSCLGGLEGATIFSPWAPCADCARAIVQTGIKRLVRHKDACDRTPDSWKESLRIADEILKAGGVEVVEVSGKLGAPSVLHSGQRWNP